jgi:nuclear receptor subfamily 1 group D protein 3
MKGNLEDSVLDQSSEHFMEHVRQVCSFAKLVPGFKRLAHEDQVTLLKACIFEVLLVRLSGYFADQVRYKTKVVIWLTV